MTGFAPLTSRALTQQMFDAKNMMLSDIYINYIRNKMYICIKFRYPSDLRHGRYLTVCRDSIPCQSHCKKYTDNSYGIADSNQSDKNGQC